MNLRENLFRIGSRALSSSLKPQAGWASTATSAWWHRYFPGRAGSCKAICFLWGQQAPVEAQLASTNCTGLGVLQGKIQTAKQRGTARGAQITFLPSQQAKLTGEKFCPRCKVSGCRNGFEACPPCNVRGTLQGAQQARIYGRVTPIRSPAAKLCGDIFLQQTRDLSLPPSPAPPENIPTNFSVLQLAKGEF